MTGHLLYTEEDERLVAQTLWDECRRELRPGGHLKNEPTPTCRMDARAVLAALSSANRLVPPGSEVREEWGVWHHFQTGALGDTRLGSEEHAMEVLVARVACGLRTDLIRRSVITTPWSPSVPDTEEGTKDG